MQIINKLLILLSLIVFSGCVKKDEEVAKTKTGIELIAIGSINFGNVVIGEYREAKIKVTNYGPNDVTTFNPTIAAPFSITSMTPPCDSGKLPINTSCNLTIRFTPITTGPFLYDFTIEDKIQQIKGYGLDSAGVINYSAINWDLGFVKAGDPQYKDLTLENLGDFSIRTPQVTMPAGYSIVSNDCGTYMASKKTCSMRFKIIKQTAGIINENINFSSPDVPNYSITVSSQVSPGDAAGSIILINPPSSIVADGGNDIKSIQTSPIRDQYGNIVEDGTEVSMVVSNLTIQGLATKTTVGGVVSFDVKSTTVKGESTVTLLAGGASGFLRFKSAAGPAVGEIIAKPYITQVEANGISQVDINFNAIRDQFNNIVEDGTQVNFYLTQEGTNCVNKTINSGTGSLTLSVVNTISGEFNATIIPPTTTGKSVLLVLSGSACGYFPITYKPGIPNGSISISASEEGIYADPAVGIAFDPPEKIQSNVTIGPVKDRFNNIVETGSIINISLEKSIGVLSGQNNFNVTTNSLGYATFSIQGIGERGRIKISASTAESLGQKEIWAYSETVIRPSLTYDESNPYKIFMTYFSSINNPQASDSNWGLLKNWSNFNLQDKSYFGDVKKQASPTLIDSNIPYFVNSCLHSAEGITYGSNCFKDNYNDSSIYEKTIKIIKANSNLDPGASVINLVDNQVRNQKHMAQITGCFKLDSQVGSVTYGEMLYYPNAPQSQCNDQSSLSPSSPVYNNIFNPWYQGTWMTSSYNIKYPTTGFIPDFAKSLIFGGFFEIPTYYSSYSSFDKFYKMYNTNQNTWASNYGINSPFIWKESDINVDYGSFPQSTIFPSITNSKKDLFMFGGLNMLGNSHSGGVEITNYNQISVNSDFYSFDSLLNKWINLSIGSDPSFFENNRPAARYQSGMVYIPDTDTIFISSGESFDNYTNNWFETNDIWSVQNISTRNNLTWKRNCFPCGFPTNLHNQPSNNFNPDTINPTPLKMVYNPFIQKVLMLWKGNNEPFYSFNPKSTNIGLNMNTNYSFNSIKDQNLFDIDVNQNIGRTYFYKRTNPNVYQSEIYYWDMDPGNIQYLKFEIDLGGLEAKTFIRSLNVHVRGYGNIKDINLNVVSQGLKVMIYNNNTESWDLIGINTATIETEDTVSQKIENSFNEIDSKKYLDSNGKVKLLISPRNNSNYTGSGYNELRLDEVYIDGLF